MKKTRITRVESWVNLGIPDCILAIGGHFVMMELKVASPTGRVKLSAHQVAFHEAHREYPCFILVEHGVPRKREIWLYPASRARELSQGVLQPDVRISQSSEGWAKLEEALLFSLGDSAQSFSISS
jgi:hypothetical protein